MSPLQVNSLQWISSTLNITLLCSWALKALFCLACTPTPTPGFSQPPVQANSFSLSLDSQGGARTRPRAKGQGQQASKDPTGMQWESDRHGLQEASKPGPDRKATNLCWTVASCKAFFRS